MFIRGNLKNHLVLLSKTADSICDGDLVDKQIRSRQTWSLLPTQVTIPAIVFSVLTNKSSVNSFECCSSTKIIKPTNGHFQNVIFEAEKMNKVLLQHWFLTYYKTCSHSSNIFAKAFHISVYYFQAIYASVLPGELMRGYMSQFPTFPSWLGKFSSAGKHSRILQELASHMSLKWENTLFSPAPFLHVWSMKSLNLIFAFLKAYLFLILQDVK